MKWFLVSPVLALTATVLLAADPPTRPALDAPEWKPLAGVDGMKIWDVKPGTGEATTPNAIVTIHYTGWLTDGKEFDSSIRRDAKATFPLGKLIKGWQKGIPGMKPGAVRRLYIPWALAYGEKAKGDKIPAKSDLVFEVEMFDAVNMPAADAKGWKPVAEAEGLKFIDTVEGKGDACKPGAKVTIQYSGWTLDGNMFDSSRTGPEPATFPLDSLIAGWQKGIPGMKPGGKRQLYIPWAMAYGEAGSPPNIPAKADLMFEVELISSK